MSHTGDGWKQIFDSLIQTYHKLTELGFTYYNGKVVSSELKIDFYSEISYNNMLAMEKLRHIPGSMLEKQEALYSGLEDKIAIMKGIWRVAQGFGIASGDDNNGVVATEKAAFQDVFQLALNRLPQAASIYRGENFLNVQDPRIAEDSRFVYSLDRGIKQALGKRDEIRSILQNLGENVSIPGAYEDFMPDKLTSVKGHIRRVVIKPFSIQLIVDDSAFQDYTKENGSYDLETVGQTLSNTIWVVSNEEMLAENTNNLRLLKSLGSRLKEGSFGTIYSRLPDTNEGREDTHFLHEDFHSFIEGFLSGSKRQLHLGAAMMKIAMQIRVLRGITNNRYYRTLKRLNPLNTCLEKGVERPFKAHIGKGLNTYIDYRYDEFLAALASSSDLARRGGLVASFVNSTREKRDEFKETFELFNVSDQDPYVTRLSKLLDENQLFPFVIGLYKEVENKAPERVEDLDMAFVLFPPSQWRQVKRLVDRWTVNLEASA